MRRLFGVALRLAAVLIAALAAFVAWALFWPAPSHAPRISCPSHTAHPCVAASGRVVLRTMSHGRPHLVLFSRRSLTLPGVVSAEFVDLRRMPSGAGFGDWVSVYGTEVTGSHHEHDIHVQGFATSAVRATCGWINGRGNVCTDHPRR